MQQVSHLSNIFHLKRHIDGGLKKQYKMQHPKHLHFYSSSIDFSIGINLKGTILNS